jgi:acyl CoA:acetate/3-ketoacid CoA transferase
MGGRRTKVITSEAAAQLVLDGDTLAIGGFVGLAVPEELLIGLANRFTKPEDCWAASRRCALTYCARGVL